MPYAQFACGLFSVAIFAAGVFGSSITVGPNGVNSIGLNLTGQGIFVGQVESGRPGRYDIDDNLFSNSTVIPFTVFRRNTTPTANELGIHALEVASVMISTDNTDSNSNGQTPIGNCD
jgi:hypothetical protein